MSTNMTTRSTGMEQVLWCKNSSTGEEEYAKPFTYNPTTIPWTWTVVWNLAAPGIHLYDCRHDFYTLLKNWNHTPRPPTILVVSIYQYLLHYTTVLFFFSVVLIAVNCYVKCSKELKQSLFWNIAMSLNAVTRKMSCTWSCQSQPCALLFAVGALIVYTFAYVHSVKQPFVLKSGLTGMWRFIVLCVGDSKVPPVLYSS